MSRLGTRVSRLSQEIQRRQPPPPEPPRPVWVQDVDDPDLFYRYRGASAAELQPTGERKTRAAVEALVGVVIAEFIAGEGEHEGEHALQLTRVHESGLRRIYPMDDWCKRRRH